MKFALTVSFALLLLSCNNTGDQEQPDAQSQTFKVDTASILKDYTTWYNYVYYNVPLSADFIGLDVDSATLDKATFLNNLMQGNRVAFKIKLFRGQPVYKLHVLNSENKNIASTVAHLAEIEMGHYKMEGKEIPSFSFTDLNGINYTNTSTRGKTMVLKCWFISCVACVKEFPDCNKLVDEYSGRNDIVFVSLAIDKKKELIEFLKTRPLTYTVVPEAEAYMQDSLNISMYPTHLLIDKTGKIVKVVNSLEELKPFLEKTVSVI
ncbi:MAG: TlpA family protein disulfide reductase [Chitinophagaceae bacterium]|nr:TlpA family protein disulfide reductase [Chitinophagaceae bacterium]